MRVILGDILTVNFVDNEPVVARCFTSNGEVNREGRAIMGRGVAKVFRDYYRGIDKVLGEALVNDGTNRVRRLGIYKGHKTPLSEVIAFPTKHKWSKPSSIELIKKSAQQLADIILSSPDLQKGVVLLPKPGCENGKLDWLDVSVIIEPILPENVVIIGLDNRSDLLKEIEGDL